MPDLVMPKMGDAMEEGTILRWLKAVGDQVAEQEEIAEIQTEKSAITIPATDAGTILEIVAKEGTTAQVGEVIARVGKPGDKPAAAAAPAPAAPPAAAEPKAAEAAPAAKAPEAAPAPGTAPATPTAAPAASGEGGRVRASPLAQKVAAEHGVDLSSIQGTGPGGRIIEADVAEALQKQGTAPAAPAAAVSYAAPQGVPAANLPGARKPLSAMRKVIAARLSQSKQTVPHFYLSLDVDMRAAAALRAQYNASVEGASKISFNDLVVRACALALRKHPAVNSQWDGDAIKAIDGVNIGVAVSLDDGLIVPVVRDADKKSISVLGREVRDLADRARANKLGPADYTGGTFTISNLGMFEITQFQAIINSPEAAILAVGAIRDTPIVENDAVVPGKLMNLTISVDHRVVDGSVAAKFMQELKRLLQNPMALFG